MALDQQLNGLERSGLIHIAQLAPELQYIFRHALVQEAAYTSLLRQDRRRLHQVVGEVMEHSAAGRLDELAPVLGQHFAEAGDHARAAHYLTLAGDHAMRRYAVHEAVAHYTCALEALEQADDRQPQAAVWRKRAFAHDALGDFECARADHEAALQAARNTHNQAQQWRALLDLGMLWAGRDYTRTGEYYQQANDMAQRMSDAASQAHALNHLGNWLLNGEQAQQAMQYHGQALAIFEQLGDTRGIADTSDFLGMASALGGNMRDAATYFRRAQDLYNQLDDQPRAAAVLATMALRGPNYQTNTLTAVATLPETQLEVETALRAARQTGRRADESFALSTLAYCTGAQGNYAYALDNAQQGLALAREIGHRQWQTYAMNSLGVIELDMLALSAACSHQEEALSLARDLNSLHWMRTISGQLAMALIAQGQLTDAEAVLNRLPLPDSPLLMIGQRIYYTAKAELALAQANFVEALRIADLLSASNTNREQPTPIPRITLLRAQVFANLGRNQEAANELQAAVVIASQQGARPMQWRLLGLLGHILQAQGQHADAEQACVAARQITLELATNVPPAMRDSYLSACQAKILNPLGRQARLATG